MVRNRSTKDRRVVFIQLSERGRKAYDHHKTFHREMVAAVMGSLSEEELHVLDSHPEKAGTIFFKEIKKKPLSPGLMHVSSIPISKAFLFVKHSLKGLPSRGLTHK